MTSREESRKYRSAAHKQKINIHGGTYNHFPRPLMHDARKFNLRACATCTTNVELADYNTLVAFEQHFCYVPYFWPLSTHPYILCVWGGGRWICLFVTNVQRIGTWTERLLKETQWRIQDFPGGGGGATPKVGVLTYYFAHFLSKTA